MKSLLTAVSVVALFFSVSANAYVSESDSLKSGELKVVDAEKGVVLVNDTKYLITEDTRIVINGKEATFSDLKATQDVSYKVREEVASSK